MLGPDSSRNEDFVSQFFESVREHGAEPLTQEENARLGTHDALKFAADNKGHRLADDREQSQSTESGISFDTVSILMLFRN